MEKAFFILRLALRADVRLLLMGVSGTGGSAVLRIGGGDAGAGGALLALLTALGGQPSGLVPPLPALANGWLWLVLATSLAFISANLGLQFGAARLPAATTSLVMLTEVVFASVSSVLMGAAELQGRTLLGGALILLAALWAAWPARTTLRNIES